jgi:drug/metabolite transporter (DMT)-like permease
VNPLVAVALGYFLAGEVLTVRMILAAALIVASVLLLVTAPAAYGRRLSP